MSEDTDYVDVNHSFLNSVSSNLLSVIQIDLLITTLYLSALGIMFKETNTEFIVSVANSSYTLIGFQFVIGSALASSIFYFEARRTGAKGRYSTKGPLDGQTIVAYYSAATIIGSVLGVISLLVGVIDGFSPTSGIPLGQTFAFGIPFFSILIIYSVLSLPEIFVHLYHQISPTSSD